MIFENGHVYHIYNQGNNRQKVFFNREHYLFFLRKIREHITPFADVLAWCLMPNHFHLMVYVKEVEIANEISGTVATHGVTRNRISGGAVQRDTHGVTRSHPVSKKQTLNNAIGIMLRSYTRAINKQENRSGALFREGTKAECLTRFKGLQPSFYNTKAGTVIPMSDSEKEYPQVCFNYIHWNPLEAELVKNLKDWEFSSYWDYAGWRNGTLICREQAEALGLKLLVGNCHSRGGSESPRE